MQILRTVAELRTRVRGWKQDGRQAGDMHRDHHRHAAAARRHPLVRPPRVRLVHHAKARGQAPHQRRQQQAEQDGEEEK